MPQYAAAVQEQMGSHAIDGEGERQVSRDVHREGAHPDCDDGQHYEEWHTCIGMSTAFFPLR